MRALHASLLGLSAPALVALGCELVAGFGDPKLGDPSGATGTGGTTGSGAHGGGGTGTTSSSTTTSTIAIHCDAGASACQDQCVDLQSDQRNCGRCGHDCLHGMCSAGVCQPWTVVSSANVGFPSNNSSYRVSQIATDGQYLAWFDATGTVHQVPVAGGTSVAVNLKAATGDLFGPVLAGGKVVYIGSAGTTVCAAGENQTTAFVYATVDASYQASSLAYDPPAGQAFLSGRISSAQYKVLKCPFSGGSTVCTPLELPDTAPLVGFQVTATYGFWGSITRWDRVANTLGTISEGVFRSTLDSSSIYWSTSSQSSVISSLPQSFTAGSTPKTLTTSSKLVIGLAADGTNVYFGDLNIAGNASLYYAPVAGGSSPIVLYTSTSNALIGSAQAYVVAGGGAVYWADIAFDQTTTSKILGLAAP